MKRVFLILRKLVGFEDKVAGGEQCLSKELFGLITLLRVTCNLLTSSHFTAAKVLSADTRLIASMDKGKHKYDDQQVNDISE